MKTCPACQKIYPDDFFLCPRDGAPLTAQATETEAQLAAGLSRRFRLVRRLGQGGMGTVFLAEQIGVGNRPVALKVLSRKLLDDPDFLLRFQNEAGSTGRIRHANVVTIYESAQADDGTPYIAMEFLEGETLRELVKKRGALPVAEVVEIVQQVADGLDAAHDLGIIHRDLKPDNIFLTRDKRGRLVVKVVDFGIAKLRESAMHTQTGMVLGTPAYMSCEQASGMRSDELDARSDIYSLGVVVYEMLTGRVPFHSDTPLGYLRKHMLEPPPPFRAVAQGIGVPPAVESAVMKALAKDRDQRYGSVLEFARGLTSAAQLLPTPESPVTIPPTRIMSPTPAIAQAKTDITVQTPSPAPPGRISEPPAAQPQGSEPVAPRAPQLRTISKPPRKMKFVVIAVVALILIGAGAWYFSRPSRIDKIAANQASAVDSLRILNIAEITYASTYNVGYSADMASLGPPPTGANPTSTAAGLIDSVLAPGSKDGYRFVYSSSPRDASGRIYAYAITAEPVSSSSGIKYYYTDQSGVIRENSTAPAGFTDSPLAH